MSSFFGGKKKKQTMDEEAQEKRTGPYSLPPEENGDAQSVYVENAGRKYRLSTIADFKRFREHALKDDDRFTERHREPTLVVYDRPADKGSVGSGGNVVKLVNVFKDVAPQTLYDSLHDPIFRKTWDTHMLEGYCICQLDPRNDIGSYAVSFPWPLSNRDYVNMRCWMEIEGGEFIIMNRTVPHSDFPLTDKYVRGLSYSGGYYIAPLEGTDKDKPGSKMIFFSHGCPQGNIPQAIVNMAYTKAAPNMMSQLELNAKRYAAWAKEQGRDASFVPYWRTATVSWESHVIVAAAEAATKIVGEASAAAGNSAGEQQGSTLVVARVPINAVGGPLKGQTGADNVKTAEEMAKAAQGGDAAVREQLEEMKKKMLAAAGEDKKVRAVLDDGIRFLDRQMTQFEGKPVSSVAEYLRRLHAVVDGIGRTLKAK